MARPPQISRAAILDACLAVADDQGLPAVTMQTVARRLQVTPMALYRHVAHKDDLLDGLVELLLSEASPPTGRSWQERLEAMAREIRATARRHPAAFPLVLTRPAKTDAALRIRNAVQEALREAGLAPAQADRAERLISTAVLGFAVSEATGRFAHHPDSVRDRDFTCLLDGLRHLVEDAATRVG